MSRRSDLPPALQNSYKITLLLILLVCGPPMIAWLVTGKAVKELAACCCSWWREITEIWNLENDL